MKEYLSFDDVLLKPAESRILPSGVDLRVELTGRTALNIPLISAAMDTVTGERLAVAIALEGGMGIIHRNLSPECQAREVERVKKSLSGMILSPVTVEAGTPLREVKARMVEHGISGVPVIEKGRLAGIITNRDIRFETNLEQKVEEVMTGDLVTVEEGTTPERCREILHRHRIEKLPVVDGERRLIGLITIKDMEKIEMFPLANRDRFGRLVVGAAVGTGRDTRYRVELLLKAGADMIVVDTAHGHSRMVAETVRMIKRDFDVDVAAGNIATPEAVDFLLESGADILKVGVGPGSICTTRIVTGVGAPQLSAIMNCYERARKDGVPLIADGGIRYSGDIVKALAAGARAVMLGNLLAGTDESPGEIFHYQGRAYKVYRGMGSTEAMMEGSSDRYLQEGEPPAKLVPEGIVGRVPCKGPLGNLILQLTGGLRSAMGYLGAGNIEELKERAEFIRVTQAGVREGHIHSVAVLKEAPNYWIEEERW